MTQAIRFNKGWSEEGAKELSHEHEQTVARFDYDPNTAKPRPSREEIGRAAQSLFAMLKKIPPS